MGRVERLAVAGRGYGSDCWSYGFLLVFVRWAVFRIVLQDMRVQKVGQIFQDWGGVQTVLVFWGTRFRDTSVLLKKSFCAPGGLPQFPQYTIIIIYIHYD